MPAYAAIIATRNRPEALALSLPLLLAQDPPPDEVLVVDGSDDPQPGADLIARLAPGAPARLRHLPSAPGAAAQRNLGLRALESDAGVILMPDDDSLLLPGAMAAILRVYARDEAGLIGGVCSAESFDPPEGLRLQARAAYDMTRADRLKAAVAARRFALEARAAPDPLKLRAAGLKADLLPAPPWLAEEDAVSVEWMTGFRMSFRAGLIRAVGFNERLGRYALFEDIDAGFGVLQGGHRLVGARRARIYHHKAPMRRAGARALGAMHVLNRAYVVARHGPVDAPLRRAARRHDALKLAQYLAGARSSFGRARLAGALAAARAAPAILAAGPEGADAAYLEARARCFDAE